LNPKIEYPEIIEAIEKLWRPRPAQLDEAKKYFVYKEKDREKDYIEDKLEEYNLAKIRMPVISRKGFEEIKKDESNDFDVSLLKTEEFIDDIEDAFEGFIDENYD
jgi:hypothetical protein